MHAQVFADHQNRHRQKSDKLVLRQLPLVYPDRHANLAQIQGTFLDDVIMSSVKPIAKYNPSSMVDHRPNSLLLGTCQELAF
jgi:hypothetical protein